MEKHRAFEKKKEHFFFFPLPPPYLWWMTTLVELRTSRGKEGLYGNSFLQIFEIQTFNEACETHLCLWDKEQNCVLAVL